jgi:hypothetical protein
VLALPANDVLPLAVTHKLRELAKQGATISGPSFSAETSFALLQKKGIGPDFSPAGPTAPALDFVHYRHSNADYYMVRNPTDQWISTTSSFRQTGKAPEIWNPVTGEMVSVSVYDQDQQYTQLPLSLPPYGSSFIVFKKGTSPARYRRFAATSPPPRFDYTPGGLRFWEAGTVELVGKNKPTPERIKTKLTTQEITGPWQLSFPKNGGAPASVTWPKLISWTESDQPGIKYFSGIGTYEKTFRLSTPADSRNGGRVFLDLGKLSEMADVWLNGQHLGIAWAEPYRFDITNAVKSGENTLKIEIANAWSNRLTGDALTGEKYTSTNISIGYRGTPWKQVPLLESGLLGPVIIQPVQQTR